MAHAINPNDADLPDKSKGPSPDGLARRVFLIAISGVAAEIGICFLVLSL